MAGENDGATPQPDKDLDDAMDEVSAILEFDPFKQKAGDSEPPNNNEPVTADPVSTEPEPPAPGPDSGSPAPNADHAAELAQLREQVAAQQRMLSGMQQSQQPQQTQEPATQTEEPLPGYNFTIPPQLVEQLQSDDPTQYTTGLQALLQGAAQAVHRMVRTEIAATREGIVNSIPNTINSQLQAYNTQQEIYHDFYGSFPELAAPELRSLVVNATQQVAQERATMGLPIAWGPEFKNAIATRVQSVLGRAPVAQPTTTQPAQFNNSARPGTPSPGSQNEVLDLFGP